MMKNSLAITGLEQLTTHVGITGVLAIIFLDHAIARWGGEKFGSNAHANGRVWRFRYGLKNNLSVSNSRKSNSSVIG